MIHIEIVVNIPVNVTGSDLLMSVRVAGMKADSECLVTLKGQLDPRENGTYDFTDGTLKKLAD